VQRYQSRLLAFCRHMLGSTEDAEDVLQEVFAAAFNAIRADDRPINARPWLYRIARNRCLNQLRRPVPAGQDSMDVFERDGGTTTADTVHRRQEFRDIIAGVQELPESQRTALLLREIDALSYDQIAEAMDTTIPSVKSLLVRARVSLAEAAEARLLSCGEVRFELGQAAEGIAKASPLARRHLRSCDRCRVFRRELRNTTRALAAIYPIGPMLILKNLLFAKAGAGAIAGSGAAAGGSVGGTAIGGAAGGGAAFAGGGTGLASGGAALTGGAGLVSGGAALTGSAGLASGGAAVAGGGAALAGGGAAVATGSAAVGVTAAASAGAAAVGAGAAVGSGGVTGAISLGVGTIATKAAAGLAAAAIVTAGAVEVKQVATSRVVPASTPAQIAPEKPTATTAETALVKEPSTTPTPTTAAVPTQAPTGSTPASEPAATSDEVVPSVPAHTGKGAATDGETSTGAADEAATTQPGQTGTAAAPPAGGQVTAPTTPPGEATTTPAEPQPAPVAGEQPPPPGS